MSAAPSLPCINVPLQSAVAAMMPTLAIATGRATQCTVLGAEGGVVTGAPGLRVVLHALAAGSKYSVLSMLLLSAWVCRCFVKK